MGCEPSAWTGKIRLFRRDLPRSPERNIVCLEKAMTMLPYQGRPAPFLDIGYPAHPDLECVVGAE